MDVLAIVGTTAAVVSAIGVPIAFQQLRTERAHLALEEAAGTHLAQELDGYTLFAPRARYLGFDAELVNRRAEANTLVRLVKRGRPLIAVEGIAGVGKTTLAARVSRQVRRTHQVRWVFCAEKSAALNLNALARNLLSAADQPASTRLRSVVANQAGALDIADAVIDHLSLQRTLLVLDGFEAVQDPELLRFVEQFGHSQTGSTLVLTSKVQVQRLPAGPSSFRMQLGGLSTDHSRALLGKYEVRLADAASRAVWERAGSGNPLALTLFAGRARTANPEELILNLPDSADDLGAWIAPVYDDLADESQAVAKAIAFNYGPMRLDDLNAIVAPITPSMAVADLTARFLVRQNAGRLEMHGAVRDYLASKLTEDDHSELAKRITAHYQSLARTVFIEGLGSDEPSYGTLYLESFPDYFADTARHLRFVDDLVERVVDTGFELAQGSKILVLGSGDGTHDPGFAKYGLDITDVDIQPEIVELGRAKAASLPGRIKYLVADMTEPLPPEILDNSMHAVFNIGSSFGYEDDDATNASVFRHAVRVLRDGAPFVFEYVNGPHWVDKHVQQQVEVTELSNGSTRTEVSITSPEAGTSLTLIGLQRPGGGGGWFHHFMHYYRLDEIIAMMRTAGLRPVAVYGAKGGRVTGEPYDERESEAMVIIATRGVS